MSSPAVYRNYRQNTLEDISSLLILCFYKIKHIYEQLLHESHPATKAATKWLSPVLGRTSSQSILTEWTELSSHQGTVKAKL